jgi:uncharacterized protein (TIGR02466 family)
VLSFDVTPLWPIPLYKTTIKQFDPAIAEFLKSQQYERMPANNGDYTVNKYILNLPECQQLKDLIMDHVNNFVYTFLDVDNRLDFRMENSWVNRHSTGDFAGLHFHNNALISGCFYLENEEGQGDIAFYRDKLYNNLFNNTINVKFNESNKHSIYTSHTWPQYPRTGDLLLWPSHLNHSTSENNTDKLRYSLAFNIFPRGKVSDGIDAVTL